MARIRSIHPGYNRSEDIAGARGLSKLCRFHFSLLWTYCDDEGRGRDSSALIKAECWPLDDDVTQRTIDKWMDELQEKGRIVRYEADGRRFFEVVKFTKWQRPQKRRESDIPPPLLPPEDGSPTVAVPPQDGSPTGQVEPVVGEGVGEGVGEVDPPPSGDTARTDAVPFEAFWPVYPPRDGKKLGKREAEAVWKKLGDEDRRQAIIGARHLAQAIAAGGKFGPPDAERWLKNRKWPDWQEPARSGSANFEPRPVIYR